MRSMKTYSALIALAAAVVLVLSACGGGGDNGAEGSAPGGTGAATTVSVEDVDGVGKVLVDSKGAALYASDQESNGTVLCVDGCTTIWLPLTVDRGAPTGGDGVASGLGVAMRPDGTRQVTFDGRLLYSFAEDTAPGTVTGNGFSDAFGDRAFTWHVATPTGVSTSNENSSQSSGPYGY
jgi:predicted lipoprotein with Yx(FWY)xxD motif